MSDILKRREDESEFDHKVRLCVSKLNKEIDLDWIEIIDFLKLNMSPDHLRKLSYAYKEMIDNKQDIRLEQTEEDEFLDKLTQKKLELQKERVKLQAEKTEINKWIREQGRSENFYEKLLLAVENRKTVKIPTYKIERIVGDTAATLDIADQHYGKEVLIRGFEDEIINEYNVEIFERRMWTLLENVISKIEKERLTQLTVFNLSDSIEGILRMSALQSLQLGILDSAMGFAEFMTNWLNELSKYVYVDYHSVQGNHTEIRPLGSSKGDFPHENMERIVTWYLKTSLKDNPNITIHDNKPFVYLDVVGTKILATHGQDERNLENSIKDYVNVYGKQIHMLKTGHLHNIHNKTIGMDGMQNIEFYQAPSICGIDEYSVKLKKTANAGATMMVFERGLGRTTTYDFKLK
jgi:hypothetical protein